jgi:hypothetical protein
MSWHYLQGQEAAFWEGDCLDGAPSALSRLIPMRAESYLLDRLTDALADFQSGTTCEPSTESDGGGQSISSLADFPVRTSAQPDEGPESQVRGLGYGPRWRALSARFDRASCSWKTAHCLFQEDLPWSSVILPRWGMMRDGDCWERNTPELPISGIGFGSWPTPVADGDRTTNYAQGGTSLGWAVRNVPTPTVHGNYNRKGASRNSGNGLATWVKHVPTPTCHDRKGKLEAKRGKNATGGPCLTMVVGGTLNPTWVEWLMGWPLGWTDCDALETGKFRQWLDSHGIR